MTIMLTKKITQLGNSGAIVLPKDILAMMNIGIGDEVELSMNEKSLIMRPLSENTRRELFQSSLNQVMIERKELLKRLAKGVDEK
jgi:putative addiction module antidote